MNIEEILAWGANKRRILIDHFRKTGIEATIVDNRYLKIS